MAMTVSPSSGLVYRIISIEIIVGRDQSLGLSSFQNCSSGTNCGTVVWDLSWMILVMYYAYCFMSWRLRSSFYVLLLV